jgi:YHS domain-containing protein
MKGAVVAKDVVCGMQVDEEQAEADGLTSEYQGETFYFCSPGCKQAFEQNPEAYVGQQSGQA